MKHFLTYATPTFKPRRFGCSLGPTAGRQGLAEAPAALSANEFFTDSDPINASVLSEADFAEIGLAGHSGYSRLWIRLN